jgi:hypothetical protein
MPKDSVALSRWLVGAILMVAMPSIACFGYYSVSSLGEASGAASMLIVLAYPMALIGLCALVATAMSQQRTSRRLWTAALCFAVPATFLLLIRN